MAYFIPQFDVQVSDDRASILIADDETDWTAVIDSDFSIRIVSEYESELGISIDKTITRTDLGLETTDIIEGFEFTIPAALLIDSAEVVPDSIYIVYLQLVETDAVVAYLERKEVIYSEMNSFIDEETLNLNINYPSYKLAENIVIDNALKYRLLVAADYGADSDVIEILKYFKSLI